MSRRHVSFACEGSQLVGTIDEGADATGLLIVSGGNETRAGAWNGQALLAARLAAAGHPVMRFDRRGVADSEGPNGAFRSSAPDIAAALAAFREQCPHLARIVGFGNCDAASALMLARGEGFDALVLSNPWTFGDDADDAGEVEAPAEVVRDHYRRRLTDPAAIKRLLTGKVSLPGLVRSLRKAALPAASTEAAQTGLAAELAEGIAGFSGEVHFLIAGRDRTGLTFQARWQKGDPRIRKCAEASHSFVEPAAREWLAGQLLEMLSPAPSR